MLIVLMLEALVHLVLVGYVKMCFLAKSSGASPVPLVNDVRYPVFDRLWLKKSTRYTLFFNIFLSPLGLRARGLRVQGLRVQGLRSRGLGVYGLRVQGLRA